jgi:hypothetical protein
MFSWVIPIPWLNLYEIYERSLHSMTKAIFIMFFVKINNSSEPFCSFPPILAGKRTFLSKKLILPRKSAVLDVEPLVSAMEQHSITLRFLIKNLFKLDIVAMENAL